MIKPQELRLGNWIRISGFQPDGYHDMYTTSDVQIDGFNDSSDVEGSTLICFYTTPSIIGGYIVSGIHDIHAEPVPLTEEWLLKFGFENTGAALIKQTGNGGSIDWDGMSFYVNMILHENLKFVHQLQNLFYSLTGEELTIKETP